MDTYDLSHKLEYAGRRSPVPFITGPEYTNSVPGVPVLSELRVFIPNEHWSRENAVTAAREICRVLGSASQFDIGMTVAGTQRYNASLSINGDTARLTKLNPESPEVSLRFISGDVDELLLARFPRLTFEPAGEDYWRSVYAPGAVKVPSQQ
jgi:hypothetical protein